MLRILSVILYLFGASIFKGPVDLRELGDVVIADLLEIYKILSVAMVKLNDLPVAVDKIKLALYTKRNPKVPKIISPHYPIMLSRQSPIVFILHGWRSNVTANWFKELKDAFLKINNHYYVVEVDWSVYSKQDYFVAVQDVKKIGGLLGEFIVKLNAVYSIPLANFLIVGHSLGAHISGFMGKKITKLTNRKLPRIIALDPAGPEFETRPKCRRLHLNDADVVHVIHTSIDNFGFNEYCGTVDFYPNGGSAQPGCITEFPSIACSHLRSTQYLVAALLHPEKFLARKCGNWSTYLKDPDLCDDEYVSLGDLNHTKTGNFYLKTTKGAPYYHRIL